MAEFQFQEMFPLAPDETPYRQIGGAEAVRPIDAGGRRILEVEPSALTELAAAAMRDIAHLLRPSHLAQLRAILDDPEASDNDRFVALALLKNANVAAGMVLPSCQDTGTAMVMGKKGQYVWTPGGDEESLSRGIFQTYTETNLR
ncbi:MAG: fumarate hydratase, partial [Alphaproteobacteria bacterium]